MKSYSRNKFHASSNEEQGQPDLRDNILPTHDRCTFINKPEHHTPVIMTDTTLYTI